MPDPGVKWVALGANQTPPATPRVSGPDASRFAPAWPTTAGSGTQDARPARDVRLISHKGAASRRHFASDSSTWWNKRNPGAWHSAEVDVRFHRVNEREYRLEVVRADGFRDQVVCETRSLLRHDLVHFALESAAGLSGGFWGALAAGDSLQMMNDRSGRGLANRLEGLMSIERVVGALQGAIGGDASPGHIVRQLREYHLALGEHPPDWVNEAVISRTLVSLSSLEGHWRATRTGEVMALNWRPEDGSRV